MSLAPQQPIAAEQAVKSELRLLSQQHPTKEFSEGRNLQRQKTEINGTLPDWSWEMHRSLGIPPLLLSSAGFLSNQSAKFYPKKDTITDRRSQMTSSCWEISRDVCLQSESFLSHSWCYSLKLHSAVGFQSISISIPTCSTRMPMEPKEFGPNH